MLVAELELGLAGPKALESLSAGPGVAFVGAMRLVPPGPEAGYLVTPFAGMVQPSHGGAAEVLDITQGPSPRVASAVGSPIFSRAFASHCKLAFSVGFSATALLKIVSERPGEFFTVPELERKQRTFGTMWPLKIPSMPSDGMRH